MSEGGFIQRGGLWVAAQNTLTVAALLMGPLFRAQWHNMATTIVGIGLFGVGGWFGIAGVRALGRNLTPYPNHWRTRSLFSTASMDSCAIRSTAA